MIRHFHRSRTQPPGYSDVRCEETRSELMETLAKKPATEYI